MENSDRVIERALALFQAVAVSGGNESLSSLAASKGVALSTAQRWMASFEGYGMLVRTERGRRCLGIPLVRLARAISPEQVMRDGALPLMRRFARQHRKAVHLGVWDGEMVSYIAKASSGPALFTREGMMLEGYGSAIGKVLLAALPSADQAAYLSAGPFVPLTSRTIVSPELLQVELDTVSRQGFAVDDGEVQEGLTCCAVPLFDVSSDVVGALSVSTLRPYTGSQLSDMIASLSEIRDKIADRLFPRTAL